MNKNIFRQIISFILILTFIGCKTPKLTQRNENKDVPISFNNVKDTINTAQLGWKSIFC